MITFSDHKPSSTLKVAAVLLLMIPSGLLSQVVSSFQVEPRTGEYPSWQKTALYDNGYFYLAGSSYDSLRFQPSIMKVDTAGNLIWHTSDVNPYVPSGGTSHHSGPDHLFNWGEELYALDTYLWRIDPATGIIKWHTPINLSFGAHDQLVPFGPNHVLTHDGFGFIVINKENGNIDKLVSGIGAPSFCVDSDFNIYVALDDAYAKYDSSFNEVWFKEVQAGNNPNVESIMYHQPSEQLFLSGASWRFIICVNPTTGDTLWQTLLSSATGESKPFVIVENEYGYFLWGTTKNSEATTVVAKVNIMTGEQSWLLAPKINNFPFENSSFDLEGDFIYVSGEIRNNSSEHIGLIKVNKHTGETVYLKNVTTPQEAFTLQINALKVTDQYVFAATNDESDLWPGHEHFAGQNVRSTLLKLDETTGDSLNNFLFPGIGQGDSRTTHLISLGSNSFLAATQLGDTAYLAWYDYNLNKSRELKLGNYKVLNLAATSTFIGVFASGVWEQNGPIISENGERHVLILDLNGQVVYNEEMENFSTLDLISQHDKIMFAEKANLNQLFKVWQWDDDTLINPINMKSPGGTIHHRLIPVSDHTSLLFEAYSQLQTKRIYVNLYNDETKTITRLDTLHNYLGIKSAAIRGNELYLNASLSNNPMSASVLLKYNITSRQPMWEILDRSFSGLYILPGFLFGTTSSSAGTHVFGMDEQGSILWESIVPVPVSGVTVKLDSSSQQLILYGADTTTFTQPYISLYTVTTSGKVEERFHYTGLKRVENHLYDVLPIVYQDRPYLITAGAFHHPQLRKTAFIQVYDQSIFKKSIRAIVYFDQNQNKVQDSGESDLYVGKLRVNDDHYYAANAQYGWHVFHYKDLDTLTYLPAQGWIVTTDSVQYLIGDDTTTLKFGIYTDQLFHRAEGIISSYSPWRCNQGTQIKVKINNSGLFTISGNVQLIIPEILNFNYTSRPVDEIHGDTLIYYFNELKPSEFLTWIVQMQIPGPESLGTHVISLATEYYVSDPDDTYTSHTSLSNVVRCSYDPNDKLVNPNRGENHFVLRGDTLSYMIRFQNTGNDTAFLVEILDTLSPLLDLSTIKFMASSHPCEFTIKNNIISAYFPDIELPDSNVNFLGSQGFVHFTILPKNGLPVNSELLNRAGIYFDFNPVVITNETKSVLVDSVTTATKDIQSLKTFTIVPNPASGKFYIQTNELNPPEHVEILIFDCVGRISHKEKTSMASYVDVSGILPGIYFVHIKGYGMEKLVVW